MKKNTENRTAFRTARFTPGEAAELDEHAEITGVSVSALMRGRTLGQPLPRGAAPAINLQAYGSLKHTTDNFNQVAKNLNRAALADQKSDVTLSDVQMLLIEMDEKVKKLRLGLLGAST